jgi:hypothetical protein
MRIGELAVKIGVHRVHAWRLAMADVVPGTKKTEGGHFYFVKSRALTRWINLMQGRGSFRRKEMARAYERGYGKQSASQKREAKELLRHFKIHRKKAAENRREFKGYSNQYEDLFEEFFYDTDDLIRILEELINWHDCEVRGQMVKASSERLTILRDLINAWLAYQVGTKPPA